MDSQSAKNPIYSTSCLACMVTNFTTLHRPGMQLGLIEWYLPSILLFRSRKEIVTESVRPGNACNTRLRDQRLIQGPGAGKFSVMRGRGELLFKYRFSGSIA